MLMSYITFDRYEYHIVLPSPGLFVMLRPVGC